MLGAALDKCPEALWIDPGYPNKFWHIAFHALFYTHLYLAPSEAEFEPWAKHRPNYQYLGNTPWPPYERPKIEDPYTKHELREYHQICGKAVDATVPSLDLSAPSGFHWLAFNKLEVQLYNIRHLQHHTGQLIDRLRTAAGIGVAWSRVA